MRAITGLGLKDAKDLVEGAPKPVKEGVKKEEADEIKQKIEAAGWNGRGEINHLTMGCFFFVGYGSLFYISFKIKV